MFGRKPKEPAKESKTLAHPSPELAALLMGGQPTFASVDVTPTSAMRVPAVAGCVRVIAEAVSQTGMRLFEVGDDGERRPVTDHRLARALATPNPWTSGAEFRLNMMRDVLLHGNAFAVANMAGAYLELIQVPASHVAIETDDLTFEPVYRVTLANGTARTYRTGEILHLRTFGAFPNVGDSPIDQAREAIGCMIAMQGHASRLFGAGARPSGVLKYDKQLSPDQAKRLRESFEGVYGGASQSARTIVLESGLSYEPLQFSSVDLQFVELHRAMLAEVARVFRVPLHLIQELERTTHANAESLGRQFVSFTLMPWLTLWKGALSRLLDANERERFAVEFDTRDLMRADTSDRFEAYSKAVLNGLMSPNEVRALENLPPYEGGDRHRLPLNTEDAAPAPAPTVESSSAAG